MATKTYKDKQMYEKRKDYLIDMALSERSVFANSPRVTQVRQLNAFIAANPKATAAEYARCMNNKIAKMQGEIK